MPLMVHCNSVLLGVSSYDVECTMLIRMISILHIAGLPLLQLDSICYGDHECMMAFTAPL